MYSNKKYKKTLVILIKNKKKYLSSPSRHSRNQEINAPVVAVVS